MGDTPAPIIIIKKKGGHGGHHGGAWKVAYADFVTAMMAFFMVMWLMNSTPQVKEAVAGYFNDPTGEGTKSGSGMAGAGESLSVNKDDMEKLKEHLEDAMKQSPELQKLKDQVDMTVTGEGLRIELLETEKGMFFDSGSSNPSINGEELLIMMAKELGQLPNDLLLEGHTDAKAFNADGYSNWELSADRANMARRVMEVEGLREGQVTQVRGFADRRLRKADVPEDPSNRRISVIVKYLEAPDAPDEPAAGSKPASQGEHH